MLNFQSLQVVSRYRDPQPEVTENYLDLRKLGHNVYCCHRLEPYFTFKIYLHRG